MEGETMNVEARGREGWMEEGGQDEMDGPTLGAL